MTRIATVGGEIPAAPASPRIGRSAALERRRLSVRGLVQGVGFRPFVHSLADRHDLGGFVLNHGQGVTVEVEGPRSRLDAFTAEIRDLAPAAARVDEVDVVRLPARGERSFSIQNSAAGPVGTLVPPDTATCAACLGELFDPADRRYRYPFINCAQCGPRLTILRRLPYDRPNTTMDGFAMCPECRREYEDPGDRRFHAEPIACPACGPALSMPLSEAEEVLAAGAILAVKGIGGYHLACDATNEDAVARLRERKHREQKPLAIMAAQPETLAHLDEAELRLLRSPASPIVLAPRRDGAPVAQSVAPATPWLGIMLPYSPLHHLLARDLDRPLVMTSGNRSEEPIATDDDEARDRLAGIADAFLAHDRPIRRRCEDSVVREGFPIRRSRGYAPLPLELPVASPAPLLAVGAELKGAFCAVRGGDAFISPHLGDLVDARAFGAFRDDAELYLSMLEIEPEVVVHDLHPDYMTTRWALERDAEAIGVQHHHAHAAACLAEHGETGPALAVVLDGTGFGDDGTLWGGEVLYAGLGGFERLGHLEPVPMPGGEAAIVEPWRMAAAYLERAGRPVPFPGWRLVRQSLSVNAPLSSGAGRLFDAVAAIAGVRERISYEGQAAAELEVLAADAEAAPYECRIEAGMIAGSDLVAAAHDHLEAGCEPSQVAAAFHEGLAAAFARACALLAEDLESRTVVLSGGCMQNLRLAGSLAQRLRDHGFRVLAHRRVPPGDGGISYGQAAVAAWRLARCA